MKIRQDFRDTPGHWIYWAFRVKGAAGRTLTFDFGDSAAVGSRGAAVSCSLRAMSKRAIRRTGSSRSFSMSSSVTSRSS